MVQGLQFKSNDLGSMHDPVLANSLTSSILSDRNSTPLTHFYQEFSKQTTTEDNNYISANNHINQNESTSAHTIQTAIKQIEII